MHRLIHKAFEQQVARAPSAIALTFDGIDITYGELNQRANCLATRLRVVGVQPGTLVGIYTDRSIDLVVGILGILKAGGAYLPIDPACPPKRLAFMLADSDAPILLTQKHLLCRLSDSSAQVVLIEELIDFPSVEEGPCGQASPDDPVYVIYTSGSTGMPKGVVVTHANVSHLFEATAPLFHFGPEDVWTLFHSAAFDFSVWELWGALIYGGRLVIVPYKVSRSPEEFYELLREQHVTVVNQTPSAFRQLVRAEESAASFDGLALRLIIFGGEALDPQILRPWFERHGDQSPVLVNMYGITETTVHVTYRPMSLRDLSTASGNSPIGRPIPNLEIHLLGPNSQPVEFGEVGEIHVSGPGVARGYLNRPDLTADRFIPDPFDGRPGSRLYKSGDLARLRADGELEFLGRADDQVKIRGFRIELGEIEAVLARHSKVRESVVVAREDEPGVRRLVAYVAVQGRDALDLTELRDRLKETLPEYMVPAAIMVLKALPLNINGKVDRSALPAPGGVQSLLGSASTRNDAGMGARIAEIWASVLGRVVGPDDNFFDLGACSLDLVEVHSRLREQMGYDVSITGLFEHSTARSLARFLEGNEVGSSLGQARAQARRQKDALASRKKMGEARR
jgi:amino acid adenylation domain-containing protein